MNNTQAQADQSQDNREGTEQQKKRLVWDLPLRLFHWVFAVSFIASWATVELGGYDYMQYHFWLGYWMLGLIVFRIIWGFVGPKHARFSNFLSSPPRILNYARSFFRRDSTPSVGHNPMGGIMVVVMLFMMTLQAATGLFTTDDIIWEGPYRGAVSGDTADFLASIHHANINWLWMVVALHVSVIVFYWLHKKQNLVAPMFTGKKPATIVPAEETITSSQLIKAAIVIAISAAAVYGLINFAPEPAMEEYYY